MTRQKEMKDTSNTSSPQNSEGESDQQGADEITDYLQIHADHAIYDLEQIRSIIGEDFFSNANSDSPIASSIRDTFKKIRKIREEFNDNGSSMEAEADYLIRSFAKTIKSFRERFSLSSDNIEDSSGVSSSIISQIENGLMVRGARIGTILNILRANGSNLLLRLFDESSHDQSPKREMVNVFTVGDISTLVKSKLLEKNISISELSNRTGLHKSVIFRVVSNEYREGPTIKSFAKIMKGMNYSIGVGYFNPKFITDDPILGESRHVGRHITFG